jgi:dGTPase
LNRAGFSDIIPAAGNIMPRTREELETLESQVLAPYAEKSAASRGRVFPEAKHWLRTEFQRDRDRIIHSRSFRRLEYKTQVFLNGTGDHYRTRLTHTMEVAAIAKGIARALRLNEDLTETIALAHDLGHSPFGHSGEDTLNELMREHGGFEHNSQSMRIVTELEQKYPEFDGLNLTWEVREGLAKHQTQFDAPPDRPEFKGRSPSLEAQIANLADEVTYYSHDLDDGLEAELIHEEDLRKIDLWREATETVDAKHPGLEPSRRRYFVIRCLIDAEVNDVIATSDRRILDANPKSPDDARGREPLIGYSEKLRRNNQALRDFLYQNLYYHPEVHGANQRACETMRELFRAYCLNPRLLGATAQARIAKHSLHRAVCDYISGMTDRYALDQYEKLLGKKS